MRSPVPIIFGLHAASGSTFEFGGATLSVKSEMSGWAIPLFTHPTDERNPLWFSLKPASSSYFVHPSESCPHGLACRGNELSSRDLFLADGTNVGQPSVENALSTSLEYMDVCGIVGIGPRSALLSRGALYIHGVDASRFLLKPIESRNFQGHGRNNRDRWESTGKLVRRKSGRFYEILPDESTMEIDLLSDDVVLPSYTMSHFTGKKTKLGVAVRGSRLYLPCNRFDRITNAIYDLVLQVDGQDVRVPVKRSLSHSKITDQGILFVHSELCATNLVFTRGKSASIGRSVLDHQDVILDGRNGAVRFIPFDSQQRLLLDQPVQYQPPRLQRFHLDVQSLQVFDSEPVRHTLRWAASRSAEWTKNDFIFTNILRNDQGVLDTIELKCLKDCSKVMPNSLGNNWYGSPNLEVTTEGDYVLSEVMGDSRYELSINRKYELITIKFTLKGKRFVLDDTKTVPRRLIYLSAVTGAIREEKEFVTEWPINGDLSRTLRIYPAVKSQFKQKFSTVLYGKPQFRTTSQGDIEIRATNTAEGKVYPLQFTSDAIEVGFSRRRWHQVSLQDSLVTAFNFAPLSSGDQSNNDFALYSLSDAKLTGDIGRYSFSVMSVPGSPFRENPLTLLADGRKWIGEPVLKTDSQTGWISIIPSGHGLEYEILTRSSHDSAELFFIAKQAQRFMVSFDSDIANGGPVVFAPVRGLPVEGEFILSIGSLPPALETFPSGVIRMTFHSVRFHYLEVAYMEYNVHLFGGAKTGRWFGTPELVMDGEGALQLQPIRFDQTPYIFNITEDLDTNKVILDFRPIR